MEIKNIDLGEVNPNDEKFVKVVVTEKDLEIEMQNVSLAEVVHISEQLIDTAMRLNGKINNVHAEN